MVSDNWWILLPYLLYTMWTMVLSLRRESSGLNHFANRDMMSVLNTINSDMSSGLCFIKSYNNSTAYLLCDLIRLRVGQETAIAAFSHDVVKSFLGDMLSGLTHFFLFIITIDVFCSPGVNSAWLLINCLHQHTHAAYS